MCVRSGLVPTLQRVCSEFEKERERHHLTEQREEKHTGGQDRGPLTPSDPRARVHAHVSVKDAHHLAAMSLSAPRATKERTEEPKVQTATGEVGNIWNQTWLASTSAEGRWWRLAQHVAWFPPPARAWPRAALGGSGSGLHSPMEVESEFCRRSV